MDANPSDLEELFSDIVLTAATVDRFRRNLTLFRDAAAGESESSLAVVSDWIHNLEMLRDSSAGVAAIRPYLWASHPLLARNVEHLSSQFHLRTSASEYRMRRTDLRGAHQVRAFVSRNVIDLLSEVIDIADSVLVRAESYSSGRIIEELDTDQVVSGFWSSRHHDHGSTPDFEHAMAWEEAELNMARKQRDALRICRALRRMTLVHYSWGSVIPDAWSADRHRVLLAIHEEELGRDSSGLLSESIRHRIALLRTTDRRAFAPLRSSIAVGTSR